ncbi:probable bifunctional dTTP/UTP pyrophosphatase/methyltransferase protein isoform X3 [Cygnus atratus]|uniref:probable bifunctional dTTP/UTP pyrophosphatase/methyltransferase protein isoform X3 n=1 Tax=Cygnus atratus TaxID=8868 RepID=UPI0021B7717A|nr:probable bifunctional dTTP/UTP pyrophosphatase/methyltransferase protein isoform X3 [Cygnus atratus]
MAPTHRRQTRTARSGPPWPRLLPAAIIRPPLRPPLSRAVPCRAEPSRAEPCRAVPSRAEPSRGGRAVLAAAMALNPVLGKLVSKRVVLASASPRRQEILTNVGLRFEVVPSWFKETLEKSSFAAPYEYAIETAKQKALEVANRMHVKHLRTPDVVIGADTIVTVDEQILEKPVDKQDAYRMLSRLSGKEHSVFTGVAIIHCSSKGNQLETEITDFYEETKVKFSDLSEELLWEYIHSGEPMDKAGGYGIQALGGMLVEYVHGDFLNVVGFPLNHFCKKLAELYYPPPKHTVQHIKHDSIPSVDTFENLSDGESESSNFTEHKGANKLDSSGMCSSRPVYNCENSSSVRTGFTVPLGNQNGVSESAAKLPSKILDLMDGFKASKDYYHSQEVKQRFMAAMHSIAHLTARDVATAFDLSQFKSTCDLGGCTGALAHELIQIYPNMKVTVFDLPEVIANISYFQPSEQCTAPVTFVSGDFFKDNLPEADLYILSRVLHDWPDEKIHLLLSKISAVCKPGSALLVAEIVLDEQKTHPPRAVLQSLSMTEGKQRSGSEYKQLLEKYGFTNIQLKITGTLLDAVLCFKKNLSP